MWEEKDGRGKTQSDHRWAITHVNEFSLVTFPLHSYHTINIEF